MSDQRAGLPVVDLPTGASVSAALRRVRETVRMVRTQRRLTQREAAEQIGMINTELCRFERGTLNPTLTTLLKITDWIGDTSFDSIDDHFADEPPADRVAPPDVAEQKVVDLLAALEESVKEARAARQRRQNGGQ